MKNLVKISWEPKTGPFFLPPWANGGEKSCQKTHGDKWTGAFAICGPPYMVQCHFGQICPKWLSTEIFDSTKLTPKHPTHPPNTWVAQCNACFALGSPMGAGCLCGHTKLPFWHRFEGQRPESENFSHVCEDNFPKTYSK